MSQRRPAFALIEVLVVVGLIALLIGLLIPAVQKVRESANRARCQNNLKQIALGLHNHTTTLGQFPAGVYLKYNDVQDGWGTGFTHLLPYLEQSGLRDTYRFDLVWDAPENYAAVGTEVRIFYCPSNRTRGGIDLEPIAAQWSCPLPPYAAGTDYAFCKGANAALHPDTARVPPEARGVFGFAEMPGLPSDPPPKNTYKVRLIDVVDGTANTLALGDATGGSVRYPVRSLTTPGETASDPNIAGPTLLDQSWGATGFGDSSHPWYGSVLAVTAQYGLPDRAADDEPMNRTPATPTVFGNDYSGRNSSGRDFVSGFRSNHPGGCNFAFCDGSVRFLREGIDPVVYRGLSTYAGGEVLPTGIE